MKHLLLLGVLGFAVVLPAPSRATANTTCEAALSTVGDFLSAYRTKDAAAMVDVMPPAYLGAHARRVGLGPGFYRSIVVRFTKAALSNGQIERLEIDSSALECRRTPDGLEYGLIPTRSITRKEGARLEIQSETLALPDGDRWWLIQINDDNQISVLREVYPSFADVAFDPPIRRSLQ